FRCAVRAWFKKPTWNNKTTDPFIAFINGFAGYDAVKAYAVKEVEERERQTQIYNETVEWNRRKICVDYTGKFDQEFLATLTQEDHNYIAQVVAATGLWNLPPDNGKNYRLAETEFHIRRKKLEEEEDTLLSDSLF